MTHYLIHTKAGHIHDTDDLTTEASKELTSNFHGVNSASFTTGFLKIPLEYGSGVLTIHPTHIESITEVI